MYGVRGILAEYERTKIAERFRLGKIRKAKEGHIMTGEAPYGYTLIRRKDKNPGYYEIKHDEAAMVKRIFLFVADEGMTLKKNHKAASRDGHSTSEEQKGRMAYHHVVPASEKQDVHRRGSLRGNLHGGSGENIEESLL